MTPTADYGLAPDDPRHGTTNGYTNLRCRCDRCRAAWRDYRTDWRRRRGQAAWSEHVAALPRRTHGRRGTYNSGCRCDLCRRADTLYMRRWRRWRRVSPNDGSPKEQA